jgi:hypothetical protein
MNFFGKKTILSKLQINKPSKLHHQVSFILLQINLEHLPSSRRMSSGLGEFDLSTFVCPFTNAILNEPVLADDGHTYSKHAILCWFKSLSERRLRIISPCTRECCKRKEISEHLVPNSDIAKSIEEYRKMRLKSVQEA